MGGKGTPAVGFGLGIERLLLRLEETGVEIPNPENVTIYIAPMGDTAVRETQKIVYELRKEGLSVDTDHVGRGLRASMKYADKLGAKFTLVLGDNEIEKKEYNVKNMQTGETATVAADALRDFLKENR